VRSLTAAAQTKIAQQYGNEPINIIGIKWQNGGNEIYYADKDIPGVAKGAILSLSPIDSVVDLNHGSDSAEYTIELDDTDGVIKSIMDVFDIHKRKVTLYQYFEGMSLADAFVLFKGEIVSPIVWSADKRTVVFNILSILEDQDVGFAPEQGIFGFVDESSTGKPWPLVFGAVQYVPGVQVSEAPRGQLGEPLGYPDQSLYVKRDELRNRLKVLRQQANFFQSLGNAAQNLSPPVQEILDKYLALIIIEDNQIPYWMAVVNLINKLQAKINKTRTSTVKKSLQKKLDFLFQLQHNFSELPQWIADQKELAKDAIELAKFEQDTRRDLYDQALDLFEQAGDAVIALAEIENFIADQEAFAKGSFVVVGGEKFPQGVITDIVINNLRIRGIFSGNVFVPQVHAFARYANVGIAPRQSRQLDALWIADSSQTLKDLFLWVTVQKLETDDDGFQFYNYYHAICKVVDQISNKILIELTEKTDTEYDYPGPIDESIQTRSDISSGTKRILDEYNAQPLDNTEFQNIVKLEALAKNDNGFVIPNTFITPEERYQFVAAEIIAIREASPVILNNWIGALKPAYIEALPEIGMWYADAGAEVRPADDESVTYVGNIFPSAIKSVHAYRIVENRRILATVPPSYYETGSKNLGGSVHPCWVKVKKPLSQFEGEQWEDEIYITQISPVGPNTVNILSWLISTYAPEFFIDEASFNDVAAKLTAFPMNFAILGQKQLIQMLKELAWQARCAIWLKGDVFYIKYLSEEPLSVATITESDIEVGSLEVYSRPTEDLVTKLQALWYKDYAQESPNKTTVEHNITKYGVFAKEFDFYGYTDLDLVTRSATFWLIRYSNSWKFVRFRCFLPKLQIETLDCITLNFSRTYVANTVVKALVESAKYDSENHAIDIEAWVPVKSGSLTPYNLFWPSSVSATTEFPTAEEIVQGNAGSGAPHSNAVGPLTDAGRQGTRPSNYGTRFLSDAAAIPPSNPVTSIPAPNVDVGLPNKKKQPPSVPPLRVPTPEKKVEENIPPEKDQEFGTVTQKIGESRYLVRLRDGSTIAADAILGHPLQFYHLGSQVAVSLNKRDGKWDIIGSLDYLWMVEATIVSVHDNHYDVEIDTVGGQEIVKAMRPYSHQRRSYDDQQIGANKYKYLSKNERTVVDNEDNFKWMETLHRFEEGEKIVIAQLRDAIMLETQSRSLDDITDEDIEEIDGEAEKAFNDVLDLQEALLNAVRDFAELSGEVVSLQSQINATSEDDSTDVAAARQELFLLQAKLRAAQRILERENQRVEEARAKEEQVEGQRTPIYWIDLNVDGYGWEIISQYTGFVTEKITTPDRVPVHLSGFGEQVLAGTDRFQGGQVWFEGEKVTVTAFRTNSSIVDFQVTQILRRARWLEVSAKFSGIIGESTAAFDVDTYHDGYSPGDTITANIRMKFEWDSGAKGVAILKDDGEYELINIDCKSGEA
jgi:hypothetical protein